MLVFQFGGYNTLSPTPLAHVHLSLQVGEDTGCLDHKMHAVAYWVMFRTNNHLFAGTPLEGFINFLDPVNGSFGQKMTTCKVNFSIQGGYYSFLDPVRRKIKAVLIKNCLLPKLLASKTRVHCLQQIVFRFTIFKPMTKVASQQGRRQIKSLNFEWPVLYWALINQKHVKHDQIFNILKARNYSICNVIHLPRLGIPETPCITPCCLKLMNDL